MRTTLTLDNDVASALEQLRETRDQSFKELVNEALRIGLQSMAAPPKRRKPFRMRTADLGRCRVKNLDNIAEVLAVAEGDTYT